MSGAAKRNHKTLESTKKKKVNKDTRHNNEYAAI